MDSRLSTYAMSQMDNTVQAETIFLVSQCPYRGCFHNAPLLLVGSQAIPRLKGPVIVILFIN